jgi:uncharacterized protein YjbJ (UPF0337 family)
VYYLSPHLLKLFGFQRNSGAALAVFGHSVFCGQGVEALTAFSEWPLRCLIAKRTGESMKPSTTDRIEGKVHELKGDVKEKAGQVTNDPKLEAEGQGEKFAGKVQKKIGQIEKVFEK